MARFQGPVRPHRSRVHLDDRATIDALLDVDSAAWLEEMEQIRTYLESYGERLPEQLVVELDKVVTGLQQTI